MSNIYEKVKEVCYNIATKKYVKLEKIFNHRVVQVLFFLFIRVKGLEVNEKGVLAMDDKQIVDLYWARSETAIEETEKKYGRYCHYIAYQILYNDEDAKEIVNDTYLKTWNTVPPQRPDPLKPYVGTISRQLSLNRYEAQNTQKRGGQVPLVLDELSECIPDNDSGADISARRYFKQFRSACTAP